MNKADNKELEEATKVLQKLKKEMDKIFNITYINNTKERRAIETVLKELKRLQEENIQQRWQLNSAFEKGFIHKDKIREKIKELNKRKETFEKDLRSSTKETYDKTIYEVYNYIKQRIKVLEELLEGK